MDYVMSEKFGLNWKEYDSERITGLIEVHQAIQKRDELQSKKQLNKSKSYGR